MNVLITGGKGYIGQYIANHFSNDNVFITTRNPHNANERQLILEDETTIKGVCKDIDVVIHTASMDERKIAQNPKDALLINSYGTRNLYLDAVECNVKKFVYFSTFHVYGNVFGIITEESDTIPKSDYGLTHLFAEEYLRQLYEVNKLPTSIIRLTNGIGLPGKDVDKWYLVVNDFCRTVVETQRISLKSNGLPRRDFISINDVCTAVDVLISSEMCCNVYNVSSEKTYSIRELAFMVKNIYSKLTGNDVKLSIPDVTKEEIENVKDFIVSSNKLKMRGWKPQIDIEDTIESILIHELNRRCN